MTDDAHALDSLATVSPDAERHNIPQDAIIETEIPPRYLYGFAIANYRLLLTDSSVCEVVGYTTPARLPNTPDFFAGLYNLRGNLIPVYDLHTVLTGTAASTQHKYIQVMGNKHVLAGIFIEQIPRRIQLHPEHTATPPTHLIPALQACTLNAHTVNNETWLEIDCIKLFEFIIASE